MKTKFWIIISVLVLSLLVILFWQQPVRQAAIATPTPAINQPGNKPNSFFPPSNVNGTIATTNNPIPRSQVQTTNLEAEFFKRELESKNAPVKFYGRVVDQDGNGIPNVQVSMEVRQWHIDAKWGNTFPKFERTTDSDGNFSVENTTGDFLNIDSVIKDGYRLSPKAPKYFGYGNVPLPFHPDQQNPVIIKMWKLVEQQQLIAHDLTRIGIPVNGQPLQFDLFNGSKVPAGGQLIVRLNRNPQILPPGRGRYDWNLELEIPTGGLIATNDDFMYQAPTSDYNEIFDYNMSEDAENWTTDINQQFYIELENGKYFGSLKVQMSTIHNTPPLGINLDIVINPNGSQNLQP